MSNRATSLTLVLASAAVASTAFAALPFVDQVVPAKVQVIKQDARNGFFAKIAKIVNKPLDDEMFVLPAADPTAVGGRLRFFEPLAPVGSPDVDLPAAGWKGLGNPPGSKGWRYKGAGSGSDPCKIVLVKEKVIKAVCKGPEAFASPFPYILPVSSDDAAAWELVIGGDRYCAQSDRDSTIKKNDGAKGIFKAVFAIPRDGQTCPSCDHHQCTPGGALLASCSACAATVCAEDSFCCRVAWDAACVESAEELCDPCGG
jgi:hypothetical protein